MKTATWILFVILYSIHYNVAASQTHLISGSFNLIDYKIVNLDYDYRSDKPSFSKRESQLEFVEKSVLIAYLCNKYLVENEYNSTYKVLLIFIFNEGSNKDRYSLGIQQGYLQIAHYGSIFSTIKTLQLLEFGITHFEYIKTEQQPIVLYDNGRLKYPMFSVGSIDSILRQGISDNVKQYVSSKIAEGVYWEKKNPYYFLQNDTFNVLCGQQTIIKLPNIYQIVELEDTTRILIFDTDTSFYNLNINTGENHRFIIWNNTRVAYDGYYRYVYKCEKGNQVLLCRVLYGQCDSKILFVSPDLLFDNYDWGIRNYNEFDKTIRIYVKTKRPIFSLITRKHWKKKQPYSFCESDTCNIKCYQGTSIKIPKIQQIIELKDTARILVFDTDTSFYNINLYTGENYRFIIRSYKTTNPSDVCKYVVIREKNNGVLLCRLINGVCTSKIFFCSPFLLFDNYEWGIKIYKESDKEFKDCLKGY